MATDLEAGCSLPHTVVPPSPSSTSPGFRSRLAVATTSACQPCATPVASRRSVVRLEGERAKRRVEHWRGVAVAACEQCGRNRVPEVADLQALDRWLGQAAEGDALRLMFAPGGERSLDQVLSGHRGSIELLIGAEGGLAPDELAKAEAAGYVPIRLGPRILRTETAGLAALAAIQCLCGDFTGR